MNKRWTFLSLVLLSSLLSLVIFQVSSIHAQIEIYHNTDWDLSGRITGESETVSISIFIPEEEGYNKTENGYERPRLYFYATSVDADLDGSLDYYFGFKGVSIASVPGANFTIYTDLLKRTIPNDIWRFKIPDSSSLGWRVLYYPDPLYIKLSANLGKPIPIFYVDLTAYTGCNLLFQIDKGLNATVGNFTTFGINNPLVPDMPDFPGYNVSIPLYSGTIIINTETSSFFTSTLSFISLTSIAFVIIIVWKRKRKLLKR